MEVVGQVICCLKLVPHPEISWSPTSTPFSPSSQRYLRQPAVRGHSSPGKELLSRSNFEDPPRDIYLCDRSIPVSISTSTSGFYAYLHGGLGFPPTPASHRSFKPVTINTCQYLRWVSYRSSSKTSSTEV